MAKALINKHVDNSMELSREDFVQDFDKAKGEIIINNDELDPSIYILNTSGIVSKISANCDVYDDTEIREEVELLSNKVSSLNSTVNTLSGNEDVKGSVNNTVKRAKSVIDAYTVNNCKISENPVLNSDDLKVSDDYSAVNASYDHIIPGDIMTQAFGKIENMMTNTALCMAAAVNDIDARLGEPTEYNDKNKPIKKATGVYKLLEDINNNMALLHPDVYNPTLSNGGTITLYRTYRPLIPIIIKDTELNLNLNNQTVYAPTFAESKGNVLDGDSDSYAFWVKEGGLLSIDGEGEIVARNATYSMAVWANGGTVEIKNGKFYNGGDGCDLIYASNGGKVYIYGGEFHATERSGAESGTKNKYSALNIKDADRATSKIVVYGGKFYGFNPANNLSEGKNTNFVAEGYESVEIEPNVWQVRIIE